MMGETKRLSSGVQPTNHRQSTEWKPTVGGATATTGGFQAQTANMSYGSSYTRPMNTVVNGGSTMDAQYHSQISIGMHI